VKRVAGRSSLETGAKSEIQNPKFETNPKFERGKCKTASLRAGSLEPAGDREGSRPRGRSGLRTSDFGFASDFEIRISDLSEAHRPQGKLDQEPQPVCQPTPQTGLRRASLKVHELGDEFFEDRGVVGVGAGGRDDDKDDAIGPKRAMHLAFGKGP